MRRRMTYGRTLIEVYEELRTVGSGTWVAPKGCESVDVFIVAGGSPGSTNGAGGNGGECITILGMPCAKLQSIQYAVGGANTQSSFNGKIARAGYGSAGGAAVSGTGIPGNKGADGVYAFGDTSYSTYKYGAGGGGGSCGYLSYCASGSGGLRGGGTGGYIYAESTGEWQLGWYESDWNVINASGAFFYGGGGGGAGLLNNANRPNTIPGRTTAGEGYQGIIILRYKKFK